MEKSKRQEARELAQRNKMAIKALERRIQVIAFDANLWDRGMITDENVMPHARLYSQEKKQLLEKIEELKGESPPATVKKGFRSTTGQMGFAEMLDVDQ
jgi:hypothetical protein